MNYYQPDLFAPPSQISGLRVRMQRACKCGSNSFVIGPPKAMHAGSLHCASCDRHAGWLSAEAGRFLQKVIKQFGRPVEPVEVRGDAAIVAGCDTEDKS
jgi:hypothetical protein